jgi:uncharacterized protein (TIGR01244 family)
MFRRIDETITVSPQISAEDVSAIKAAGFTTIVNNRPDGEEPHQPSGDAIRAAAEDHGLAYAAIPVTHAGFSHAQIETMADVLAEASGPVFAYCRSGTRSCNLWALARATKGEDADVLTRKAAGAGYDLGALRPLMNAMGARGAA